MKRFIILLVLLGAINLYAQPTLRWRITNPRIVYTFNNLYGNCDNFAFDVELCVNSGTSYYHGIELHLTNNNAALTDLDFLQGPLCGPYYAIQTYNLTNGNINLSVANNQLATSANTSRWVQLTTSWQTLGTLLLRITNSSLFQSSAWLPALMDVTLHVQKEKTFGPNTTRDYSAIDLVDFPFDNIALGRIWCSTCSTSPDFRWSQVGGTIADQPYINWNSNVNTSIWDSTLSIAHINQANSLTGILKVHSKSRLIIDQGASLTCTGNTEINTAKGITTVAGVLTQGQFIDNGTVTYNTGSFVAQSYINQNSKWHYYCPAVQLANYHAFYLKFMKYYNEYDVTNAGAIQGPYHSFKYIWNNGFYPSDTTVLPAMTGYALWSASTGPYVSDPLSAPVGNVNTGSLSYSVNRSVYIGFGYDGWNLIGNPYPSGLDLDLVTWGNTDQKAYLWDGAQYLIYDKTTPANSTYKPSGTADGIIPPQQAFFVKHDEASTVSTNFTVTNAARVITTYNFMKSQDDLGIDRLFLTAANNEGVSDNTVVNFNPVSTDAFDETLDAYKMWGNYDAPQLYYPVGDRDLTINVCPWTGTEKVIPVSFYCGVSGTYTLTASNVESFGQKHVYLVDKVTGIWQEMNLNPEYQFNYTAGEPSSRFELHFLQFALGAGDKELHSMKIYSNEQNLYVMNVSNEIQHGKVDLYDMTGRLVFSSELQNNKVSRYMPGVTEGYYAARVTAESGIFTAKVYLR